MIALAGAVALLLIPAIASALDQFMACKTLVLKAAPAGRLHAGITKISCTGALTVHPTLPPYITLSVTVLPSGESGGYSFPPNFCSARGSGGYKCKVPVQGLLVVTPEKVRGFVAIDLPEYSGGATHPLAAGADVAIRVFASDGGMDTRQYCGRLGGPPPIKNTEKIYKRKDAPPPTVCSPNGAFLEEHPSGTVFF